MNVKKSGVDSNPIICTRVDYSEKLGNSRENMRSAAQQNYSNTFYEFMTFIVHHSTNV